MIEKQNALKLLETIMENKQWYKDKFSKSEASSRKQNLKKGNMSYQRACEILRALGWEKESEETWEKIPRIFTLTIGEGLESIQMRHTESLTVNLDYLIQFVKDIIANQSETYLKYRGSYATITDQYRNILYKKKIIR